MAGWKLMGGHPCLPLLTPPRPSGRALRATTPRRPAARGQLRERLAPLLPASAEVEVTLHNKNAVGASFFSKCVSARVPLGAGVLVLIEVATNLWGGQTVVKDLRAAFRFASPPL